jgi:hypothetical protein
MPIDAPFTSSMYDGDATVWAKRGKWENGVARDVSKVKQLWWKGSMILLKYL